MKVKELITILLDMNMDKEISIEYPTATGKIVGNYSRYNESGQFEIKEYPHGIVIGISDDNK